MHARIFLEMVLKLVRIPSQHLTSFEINKINDKHLTLKVALCGKCLKKLNIEFPHVLMYRQFSQGFKFADQIDT